MKKICAVAVALLAICTVADSALAGWGSVFLKPHPRSSNAQAFPDMPVRPYDVKQYDLTLDWRAPFKNKTSAFSGTNFITVRLTEVASTIVLDAALLVIDSVGVNGLAITPPPQPDANEQLTIPLAEEFRQDTADLTIMVAYHRTDQSARGAFFYPKNLFVGIWRDIDTVYTTEDIMYTMSEPLDARSWMPCMDLPYDKANSDISIIVPNGITTASNGSLLEKTPFDANSTIWHWRSDRPISTYLMVANASTFVEWGETHQRSAAPGDTVHLVYYAWPADYYQDSITDGTKYNAKHSFRNTSWIMKNFESFYGPYPFEKYGQLPAQKFDFGGQEHQTITTINREWLRDDEEGMAHEMAHHWFGDKVTCATFKDIWLNEGFASYSQAIWSEGWGGYSWYMSDIRGQAGTYFQSSFNTGSIYDPPGADDMFNLGSTVLFYPKAACVIHMLRRFVNNDTLFFHSLRDYLDHFAYSAATTDDFQQFMSARLGIDISEFIDEWIYGTLHPQYDISWGQSAANLLAIHIDQRQDARDHFTMPVKIFAFHGGSIDTLVLQNNTRSQDFFEPLSYKVDSLGFDDDALLLSTNTVRFDPALDVKTAAGSATAGMRVWSDNDRNIVRCVLGMPASSGDRIELYNALGVRLNIVALAAAQTYANFNSSMLANGMYLVRYISSLREGIVKIRIAR